MEVMALAEPIIALLQPALPHLLGKAVDKMAESVGGEAGKGAFAQAGRVWARLTHADHEGKLEAAAQEVAAAPADADAIGALRLRVRRLLEADPALATEIGSMLRERAGGDAAIAMGERSVVVGRDANAAQINTGSMTVAPRKPDVKP